MKKIATNTPENQYEKGEVISSTDKHAIEKLEQKLREVEAEKDFIQRAEKAAKEWKKNNDFGVFAKYNIDDKNANEIIDNLNRHGWALVGSVTNRNAEIRRIKQRIEGLKKQSEQENTNIEFDGGKIVFDTQEHRIKILFDEIPSAEVRNALKKRAFKWSPKNKAWQRVYTTDAKYAVDNLFEKDGVLKKKVKIEKEPTVKQTDGLAAPTAQSSETIAFNKEILKAKREGLNTDVLLKLGKAKGELKKIVGNKEMRISQATIKKAMTKDESHIITWENLVNLPDYLNNPLAIFKSKTAGFVVLTEIINAKNKPVIAPLHIVKKGNYIEVKSLYSRKNDSTYQNWVKEDLLLYINKKSDLAFKTMGTIPNLDSKSQDKNTKKSVSNKKTAKNFGLGLPLTNEIRKKAFTDKGKLRKGWSFTDDKFLTNGKDFYIPHNKPPIFYEEIIKEIEDNSNKKLKELKKLFNEKDADYRKRREIAEKIKKKLGLSAPVVETPQELTQVFVEESPLTPEGGELVTESKQVDDQPSKQTPSSSERIGVRKNSLAEQLANAPEQSESYQIDRVDMAQFLGDMEIKNTDSLVITLTGGQGSGKTRFAFQFMNDLAQRYKVGHISIEEHPQSRLYIEKVHQYLNPTALNNIEAHDVRSLSEIDKVIRENEVIVIDSFQKIKEIDGKFEVDKDLRKKYNGKLFLVIFQQTTDGKMRGGSKSQFDGDIILFTEKFPNYQENYVYPDKNRYNHIPADQLRYNIFQQRLLPIETEEQTTENQVYDVIY
ncbi:Antirestriction protein (modular protein) [Capnocytophaga cynodegmi]|uniref:Antirestriction protein (Modular protein) n=1 Tax=Capnocytophaga cynodegmi TaxID=28189 RepID=A0A0B7H935_9FLAO|nr:Antirestriction protein (modular protein) [Capnocytophaga cynodegmi]